MQQILAILALTIGASTAVIGAFWHFRLATWDDPDPRRLLGGWVGCVVELEKWQLYWKPVALQLIGCAIFAFGWATVAIPS